MASVCHVVGKLVVRQPRVFALVLAVAAEISFAPSASGQDKVSFEDSSTPSSSSAPAPAKQFTDEGDVDLSESPLVLITHPGITWDSKAVAKPGVDAVMEVAAEKDWQSVYLQYSIDPDGYYPAEKNPDHLVRSYGGEFSFDVASKTVISMGGWFSHCHQRSINGLFTAFAKEPTEDRKILVVTEGVFEGISSDISKRLVPNEQDRRDLEKDYDNFTVPLSSLLGAGTDKKAFAELSRFAEEMYGVAWQPAEFNIKLVYKGLEKSWVRSDKNKTITIEFVSIDPGSPTLKIEEDSLDSEEDSLDFEDDLLDSEEDSLGSDEHSEQDLLEEL